MRLLSLIAKWIRKSDEVDTISSDTKKFFDQNTISLIMKAIDEDRSIERETSKYMNTKIKTKSTPVRKDGKSYVLKQVGSNKLTPVS